MKLYLLLAMAPVSQYAYAQAAQEIRVKTKFEQGTLHNGTPKGEWKYFDVDGKPELFINYDSARITYLRPDSSLHLLRIDNQWQLVRPSRAPRLLGSHDRYATAVSKDLRYPLIALRTQTHGTVRIAFTVSSTGEVRDAQVETSPSKELTQEVLKALGKQNDGWLPAIHQGQAYDSRLFLLVHFQYRNAYGTPLKNRIDLAHQGTTTTTPVPVTSKVSEQPGRFLEFVVENVL